MVHSIMQMGFLLLLFSLSLPLASSSSTFHPPPPPRSPPAPPGLTPPSHSAASMSPSELDAFYQVVESLLDGSDWRAQHPLPCTQDILPGMLCEQGNDNLMHVTRLQFGSGISRRCKVDATIPVAIAQLRYLRTLLISECVMSRKTEVPPELGNLESTLEELSLRSNKALVGTLPVELGRLKNLQVLGLSQNNLEGSIPVAIGNLKMLQHLDLSYNILTGQIPPILGSLTSLSILDLSGNMLQGSVPSSIGGLRSLQKLDLSSNMLKGTIPSELGTLASLQFLALSQNHFTGAIPSSLAKLTNLEYFLMDNNPVHGQLPSFIASWTELREFSVSNSLYTGSIPTGLASLFNVSVVNLSNNKLDGNIPASLEGLRQINYLNLSENFLAGPIPFSANFIQRLGDRLDLHGNPGLCVSPGAVSFSGDLVEQVHTCDNRGLAGNHAGTSRHSSATSKLQHLIDGNLLKRGTFLFGILWLQFFI